MIRNLIAKKISKVYNSTNTIKDRCVEKTGILLLLLICFVNFQKIYSNQLPIHIENNKEGAPITLGIPFPKGELFSVDNVRLLDNSGNEVLCQTTEVTTWQPADESIKWIWVFFFTGETSDYVLEYGEDIRPIWPKERIISTNNMRPGGGITVNTGPLFFKINKEGHGFLEAVYIDENKDKKFSEDELIASAPENSRGTFLDILDDNGIDQSKAIVNHVFREKGSGPLHTIFKIEGTYHYENKDNNPSPFSMRIHAYAGKTYIKVLHTLTYTGIPDKHKIQEGEHSNIATQNKNILSEDTADDPGWTQPNDQISGCGLTFKYHLNDNVQFATSIYEGQWFDEDSKKVLYKFPKVDKKKIGVRQNGPKRNSEEAHSSPMKRTEDFSTQIYSGKTSLKEVQKAKGWMDVSDANKGIGIGIKNFFKEYPKELEVDPETNLINGYIWPADTDPMSFERKHTKMDGQMLDNFAQGITKTTEFIYYFHEKTDLESVELVMDYSLANPVARATPEWYTSSKVYGNMAPFAKKYPEFENALQYKYDWWSYNQKWEPWYGMFDYGDGKAYYNDAKWHMWNNNEPMVDFMFWTNFMRTGNAKYYHLAQSMSKHTMDVDNVHWPKKRDYVGDINDAVDFWNYAEEPESTPLLGIGRRHAEDHWYALLSAHVWLQGWIASYYITGDQRALEVARITGDTYLKRIWGKHDLRGRRLYLSVLNLVELYDATKIEKYKNELDERVHLMLDLQKEQGGNLILDRYGYSQTYASQGLYKYYQITGDKAVRKALIDHARWVRDLPPYNHEMESYLATIYPLLIGYEFSGNEAFLDEALKRSEFLKVSPLPENGNGFHSQQEYSEALLKISNLPKDNGKAAIWETNQGLRVFGWTHAYNIPYLLYWLEKME